MDRLKIKYGTPEYVVKEDSKVVICYLPYSFENWDRRIKHLVSSTYNFEDFDDIVPLYGAYAKVKAVVRCKGNDVFDVQKGKKIALAKAENKVEMRVLSILSKINNFFIESAFTLKQRMIDSANNVKHNIDYISKF
jgi:hypothetical protein